MKAALLVLALVAAVYAQDCLMTVPVNPLTATGLATPYTVTACNQTNTGQASFVEGAVIDPVTGQISIYNPLVINAGSTPAATPVTPVLPAGGVVALWFGTNGNSLTLAPDMTGQSLVQGNCVNGLTTRFGQFAYCNAPAFFTAANAAIAAGKLTIPVLGTANDGNPCPTVRDFFVVDQDQSDNVVTSYIVKNNQVAQDTTANRAALGANVFANGSDNRLLSIALDGALGCTPFMAPNLADPGKVLPALCLSELSAAANQQRPIALVPDADPMVLEGGLVSIPKVNAYRAGVNQPPYNSGLLAAGDTFGYCQQLALIQPPRLLANMALFVTKGSLNPAADSNLFTFLADRLSASFANLNCTGILKFGPFPTSNFVNPIALTTTGGIVTAATITIPNPNMICNLIVPDNVLSAAGLATPFQLVATVPANGPCNQANPMQSAFVQGAILDLATGNIAVYNPLVIDQGTTPLITPTPPNLPANNVIALWFGSNANVMTLQGAAAQTLANAGCVNGNPVTGNVFGQFSYCNAPEFFRQANLLIKAGKLIVPPLGTALDGKPCPTTRDFFVVDQDPSDNVLTTYIVDYNTGRTAQDTLANRATLGNVVQANGSDNRLVDVLILPALGCTPWTVPDLASPGSLLPALPLNELVANQYQAQPQALVSAADPMLLTNGVIDPLKLTMYRLGVNQPPVTPDLADPKTFCQNMILTFSSRMATAQNFVLKQKSADTMAAANLMGFLGNRFDASMQLLNCTGLWNFQTNVALLQLDNFNRAVGFTFDQNILAKIPPTAVVQTTGVPPVVGLGQTATTALIAAGIVAFAIIVSVGIIIGAILYVKYRRTV